MYIKYINGVIKQSTIYNNDSTGKTHSEIAPDVTGLRATFTASATGLRPPQTPGVGSIMFGASKRSEKGLQDKAFLQWEGEARLSLLFHSPNDHQPPPSSPLYHYLVRKRKLVSLRQLFSLRGRRPFLLSRDCSKHPPPRRHKASSSTTTWAKETAPVLEKITVQ